jgi:hypothetical protein
MSVAPPLCVGRCATGHCAAPFESRHSGRTTGRFTGGCLWSWCVLARHYESGKQRTLCHKTAGALFYAMGALYT